MALSGAVAQESGTPAPADPAPATADCRTLLPRLGEMMKQYRAAASEDLGNLGFEAAMDRARKAALAGKKEATLLMVGYSSLLHGREGSFPITTVRQVCTFAERNSLPLHVATCAYFHALNPLGETAAKAKAARRTLARFEALKEPPADLAENMRVLKACLPDAPHEGR